MAEYIKREAVLKIIGDNCPPDKCGYNTEEEMGAGAACYYIGKDVEKIPTADVVPKSEVMRLQEDVDRLQEINNRQVENIKLAKAEVAREIFEEIERKVKASIVVHLEEINKEHIQDTPLYDRHSGIIFALRGMEDFIAELKKKYTEGEPNG